MEAFAEDDVIPPSQIESARGLLVDTGTVDFATKSTQNEVDSQRSRLAPKPTHSKADSQRSRLTIFQKEYVDWFKRILDLYEREIVEKYITKPVFLLKGFEPFIWRGAAARCWLDAAARCWLGAAARCWLGAGPDAGTVLGQMLARCWARCWLDAAAMMKWSWFYTFQIVKPMQSLVPISTNICIVTLISISIIYYFILYSIYYLLLQQDCVW